MDVDSLLAWLGSSALAAAALGLIAFVFKGAISTWISGSVQNRFDRQIEELKSELAQKEEEIRFIRTTALSQSNVRREELARRRLRAIDGIWVAVNNHAHGEILVRVMRSLDFEKALARLETDAEFRSWIEKFDGFLESFKENMAQGTSAELERPFVSPTVWALYSTYSAIVTLAITQQIMLKSGVNLPSMTQRDDILTQLREVLPEYGNLYDEFGTESVFHLVEPLKDKLIRHLQQDAEGRPQDEAELKWAAELTKISRNLSTELEQSGSHLPDSSDEPSQ